MATLLQVYNEALLILGTEKLAATSDAVTSRYALDDAYALGLNYCLEQGIWNFALINATLSSSSAGSFGYTIVFTKPSDFVRLYQLSTVSTFETEMEYDYIDQNTKIHATPATANTLYIRYVSNDATVGGGNLALWSSTFARYVACSLASAAAFRITGSRELEADLNEEAERRLLRSLALDSVQGLPGMLPFNTTARSLVSNDMRQMSESERYGVAGALPFGPIPKPKQREQQ